MKRQFERIDEIPTRSTMRSSVESPVFAGTLMSPRGSPVSASTCCRTCNVSQRELDARPLRFQMKRCLQVVCPCYCFVSVESYCLYFLYTRIGGWCFGFWFSAKRSFTARSLVSAVIGNATSRNVYRKRASWTSTPNRICNIYASMLQSMLLFMPAGTLLK